MDGTHGSQRLQTLTLVNYSFEKFYLKVQVALPPFFVLRRIKVFMFLCNIISI